MIAVVRPNEFLSTLATASLYFSAAAGAGPSQTAVANGLTTPHPAARSRFPQSVLIDGKQYDRLTGAEIPEVLHGKTFCPSPQCNPIGGYVEVFKDDGVYLEFGDRWEGEGRYAVINDVVVVKIEGVISKYAFYRSGDGAFVKAVVDRAGIIRSGKVFAK
jgi:hypothetical protein